MCDGIGRACWCELIVFFIFSLFLPAPQLAQSAQYTILVTLYSSTTTTQTDTTEHEQHIDECSVLVLDGTGADMCRTNDSLHFCVCD
jgi:hypothetical protein